MSFALQGVNAVVPQPSILSEMSTGYSWEGLRQVCVTLLGMCHVPECPCGGSVYLGVL